MAHAPALACGVVPTTILFIGDVVAAPGRRTVRALLPALREELELDFVVANGENAAGGVGITPNTAEDLFAAGVDAITLGNHTYRHREVYRTWTRSRGSSGRRTSSRRSRATARAWWSVAA